MAEEALNVLDVFEEHAMSFEDAQDKVKSESRVKTNYYRFDKDGEYRFRVLPIAPTLVDGKYQLDRQGYEYPLTDYMLAFPTDNAKKPRYVTVIDPTQVFPNINEDLIKVYYELAVKELGDDKKGIEALGNISTKGGAALRPSYHRCIYVIDQENPNDGIQMLQLSNSQYRDLETLKMSTWKDLRKDDPKAPCPLTHFKEGYDVIVNKDSTQKPSVKFNLSRRPVAVDKKMLEALLDMERIPSVIYRYTRFHLEATVEYLKMIDERFGFDFMVMGDDGEFANDAINTAFQQIKMSLPADDHSHFSKNASSDNDEDGENGDKQTIADLEALVEKVGDADKSSEEYKNVKAALQDFIEANDIDFQVRRYMSLQDIIDGIKDNMDKGADNGGKDKDDDNDSEGGGTDQNPDTAEPASRPARQRRQ